MAARLPLKPLIGFCQRLSTALEAGVDLRRALETEGNHAPARLRRPLLEIRRQIDQGDELWEAMQAQGELFPQLVKDIVRIGEQTGTLDRALRRLGEHYEYLRRMRLIFSVAASWPVLQAVIAAAVLGILILIIPWIERQTGQNADILGFGLRGIPGLAIYVLVLGGLVGGGFLWVRYAMRPTILPHITAALLPIPGLCGYLEATSLSRLAWTLSLADETGMDLMPAIKLGLRATENQRYIRRTDDVLQAVRGGTALSSAFGNTGVFPDGFIAALEAGEQAGRLSESLRLLSRQYQDEASKKSVYVAVLASIGVWMLLGGVIIWLIFRIFGFYLHTIEQFLP